jgi:alkylation response protein AidB-like acyl-CoA dehydrogenase
MSTFDPMAIAIDWLDAYREGSRSIVDLYASDAAVECCCGGMKVIYGRGAITEYWVQRFAELPAGELQELQMYGEQVMISYRASDGLVQATLYFGCDGKIARSVCGPVEEVVAAA